MIEVLGAIPEPYQAKILNDIAAGKRQIAVRSGHGVGKTTVLAWAIIWHLCVKFPQKTVATAPTKGQLYDVLAADTKGWIEMLPRDVQALFDVQVEHIYLKAAPNKSYVSFKVSKPETPEALAGVHSDNVLLLADEASGIPEAVFQATVGSMTSKHACLIMAGNPLRNTGRFSDAFQDPKISEMWSKHHINCHDSARCGADFFKEMTAQYGGPETNEYRVRVLGEFPLTDDMALIPAHLISKSLLREVEAINVREIWGVDVAGPGKDRTAFARRKGNVLVEPVKWWRGLDTMATAAKIKDQWDNTLPSQRPSEICVDSIGIGAGVADRLSEMGLPCRSVNVSESPAMTDRFLRLRDELYWAVREWFESLDNNIANDLELAKELKAINYGQPEGSNKTKIQSKASIKKDTKGRMSPDLADALMLTFAGTAISMTHGSKHSAKWGQPMTRNLKGLV